MIPTKLKITPEHATGDSYLLMQYRSDDGRIMEKIWNSREGVTPFMVHSRDKVEMRHVDWHLDTYCPLHIPKVGDRIFVDALPELMRPLAFERVEQEWDNTTFGYPLRDAFESKEAAVESFVEDWSGAQEHGGRIYYNPHLIEVTEGIRRQFANRAAWRWRPIE